MSFTSQVGADDPDDPQPLLDQVDQSDEVGDDVIDAPEPPDEPGEPETGSQRASSAVPAGFGPRFSAFMIDALLLAGLQLVGVFALSRQLQAAGMVTIEPCAPESSLQCQGPSTALWAIVILVVVVSTFGYHVWFDGHRGATPGKRIMGLRVADSASGADDPIGLGRGTVRALLRQGAWVWALLFLGSSPLISGGPAVLFFGLAAIALLTFLVGAFSVGGQALHDLAAGSIVTPTQRAADEL